MHSSNTPADGPATAANLQGCAHSAAAFMFQCGTKRTHVSAIILDMDLDVDMDLDMDPDMDLDL